MDLTIKCKTCSYNRQAAPGSYLDVTLFGVSEEHLVVALGEQLSEETVATLRDEPLSLLDRIKALRQKAND